MSLYCAICGQKFDSPLQKETWNNYEICLSCFSSFSITDRNSFERNKQILLSKLKWNTNDKLKFDIKSWLEEQDKKLKEQEKEESTSVIFEYYSKKETETWPIFFKRIQTNIDKRLSSGWRIQNFGAVPITEFSIEQQVTSTTPQFYCLFIHPNFR